MVSGGARNADLPDVSGGLLDLCAVHILGPAAFNVPHALVDQHDRICIDLQRQTQASRCPLLCKWSLVEPSGKLTGAGNGLRKLPHLVLRHEWACLDASGFGYSKHKHLGPFLIRPEVCKHLHARRYGILSDAIALT